MKVFLKCLQMVCIFLVTMLIVPTVYAQQRTPRTTEQNILMFDPELLNTLTSTERDAVLKAMQKQQEFDNKGTVLQDVTNKLSIIGTENFQKNAENVADGIIAFCSKLGMAASDVLSSTAGITLTIFAVCLYLLNSGILSGTLISIVLVACIAMCFRIIYLFNSFETVTLTRVIKGRIHLENYKGDRVSPDIPEGTDILTETVEVRVPRLSCFGHEAYEEYGTYRGVATVVMIGLIIGFLTALTKV